MKEINLRNYYPHYKENKIVEVPDEVANLLDDYERKEKSYRRYLRRYSAYFSIDAGDGIEREAITVQKSPIDILEEQRSIALLYQALGQLPKKQRIRVYNHYILGMSITDIAKAEGRAYPTIKESIERGAARLEKIFEKIFEENP